MEISDQLEDAEKSAAKGQRVSEWNGTTRAQFKGKYYWGAMPVAFYAGGAAHFEHQDWLGTERVRTSYNGGVEGSYISLPFGDGQGTSGADGDANHYATLDHDTETDTDHAQFRQYSNTQGRWLSPDPYYGSYDASNPQSLNRYVYAMNAPLSYVDTLGLDRYIIRDNCLYANWTSGGGTADNIVLNVGEMLVMCFWYGGGGGSSAGGGGGGGSSAGAPNNVSCSTVLPNGQTVGQVVNQYRNQLQSIANEALNNPNNQNPLGEITGAFYAIAQPHGPIDFKNGVAGQGGNGATLGQAGNFAYYAIGSGILPNWELDAGAGVYGVLSAAFGSKSFSSLTGPMFSDASAASVRNAALASNGCKP